MDTHKIQISALALVESVILVLIGAALFSTAVAAQPASSTAQPNPIDIGKIEYESKCATCHGTTGKGDGPTAPYLMRKPTDLTMLAKNNNGILPVAAMYEIIRGDKEVPGHGTRDMPVWGQNLLDLPYIFPEVYARARVLATIEYIYRLQAK